MGVIAPFTTGSGAVSERCHSVRRGPSHRDTAPWFGVMSNAFEKKYMAAGNPLWRCKPPKISVAPEKWGWGDYFPFGMRQCVFLGRITIFRKLLTLPRPVTSSLGKKKCDVKKKDELPLEFVHSFSFGKFMEIHPRWPYLGSLGVGEIA